MKFTNKIKGLLSIYNQSLSSFSRKMGVTPQATNKKAKAQTWNATDLLNLADLTDTQLAFIDKNHNPIIIFDHDDIENHQKNE